NEYHLMVGWEPISIVKPHIWGDEHKHYDQIVRRWPLLQTDIIQNFQEQCALVMGVKHVLVAARFSPLDLAMSAAEIGPGDEVIVPDFGPIAPSAAALRCGARPIPVDADETWTIDVGSICSSLSERTRAIVATHIYGHPARIDEIAVIARDNNLILIEETSN